MLIFSLLIMFGFISYVRVATQGIELARKLGF